MRISASCSGRSLTGPAPSTSLERGSVIPRSVRRLALHQSLAACMAQESILIGDCRRKALPLRPSILSYSRHRSTTMRQCRRNRDITRRSRLSLHSTCPILQSGRSRRKSKACQPRCHRYPKRLGRPTKTDEGSCMSLISNSRISLSRLRTYHHMASSPTMLQGKKRSEDRKKWLIIRSNCSIKSMRRKKKSAFVRKLSHAKSWHMRSSFRGSAKSCTGGTMITAVTNKMRK